MLKDIVTIKIESGRGGRGSNALRASKTDGGDGGNGGRVILEGSTHLYDFGRFDGNKKYKADDGQDGQKQNMKGVNAQDLILKVPLTTEVYFDGDEQRVTKIDQDKKRVAILNGGLGSFGNHTMKRDKDILVAYNNSRRENSSKTMKLVLKLQSDVIFLGFPNAGKSSMLNALTNAQVKTASYAFTTIDPQIGLFDGLRLMDLPGLIEGTHEGKGLGTRFLKHTENSRLVAHFVDLNEENPLDMYKRMRKEVNKIDTKLIKRDEIVILSKSDEVSEVKINKTLRDFKEYGISEVFVCSVIDDNSLEQLKERFRKLR